MSIWKDFNDAKEPMNLGVIPKNTTAKARVSILRGGYIDATQGWTDGCATHSKHTGAVYLQCKFVILAGEYAKRHVWHMIGLHSPKGDTWADMGRTFIKSLLNSAHNIQPNDQSDAAKQARMIQSFADLDGLVAVIKIGVDADNDGGERNTINAVVTPDFKEYSKVMSEGQMVQQNTGFGSHPSWA